MPRKFKWWMLPFCIILSPLLFVVVVAYMLVTFFTSTFVVPICKIFNIETPLWMDWGCD